jgi:multidrug efflux system outer membrane protein
MNRPALLLALPLSLLAACTTVGPDFKAPAAAAPAAFRSAPAAGATAVPERWWQLLGDAQLDALETEALAASPTVAAALARADRARALLAGTRADEQPRLQADGSVQRFRTSREVATAPVVLGRRVAIESDQYGAQVSIGWELDLWGRVRRQTEAAQAQLEAATLDAAGTRLALSADVATAWLQLRALDDEIRVLTAARSNRRDALNVVQQRFDAGATHEGDLQRARTELANADADVAELARRRALAENALSVLTGRAPGPFAATPPLALPPAVQAGVPSEVLQRRPDLAQALAMLHGANAQIGVAEAAFYPSFRLTGSAGLASDDLVSLLSAPARLFNIGPAVSLPLLDGGRNKASLAAAQAQQQEALAQFRQRVLVALREVDDSLADLAARQAIAAAQAQAAEAAERTLRVARVRYEQGAASYLEVTDADRSALAARRALAQTRAAQWQGTVQLVRALGGGWAAP